MKKVLILFFTCFQLVGISVTANVEYFGSYAKVKQCKLLLSSPRMSGFNVDNLSEKFNRLKAPPIMILEDAISKLDIVGEEVIVYSLELAPGVNGLHRINLSNLREAMFDGQIGERGILKAIEGNKLFIKKTDDSIYVFDLDKIESDSYMGIYGNYIQLLHKPKLSKFVENSKNSLSIQQSIRKYFPNLIYTKMVSGWKKLILNKKVIVYQINDEVSSGSSEYDLQNIRVDMLDGVVGIRGIVKAVDENTISLMIEPNREATNLKLNEDVSDTFIQIIDEPGFLKGFSNLLKKIYN